MERRIGGVYDLLCYVICIDTTYSAVELRYTLSTHASIVFAGLEFV